MEDIHLSERMRWSRRTLLRGLFNSRHLLITVLVTCITMIFFGLVYGLSGMLGWYGGLSHALIYLLSIGLSTGLSYWLLLGIPQGMAQERIEDKDRRVVNQGIHRSLRNSVIMGIVGGAIILGIWRRGCDEEVSGLEIKQLGAENRKLKGDLKAAYGKQYEHV